VYLTNLGSVTKKVLKRCFRENNIEEFKYLLNKETWQEVLTEKEVNAKFEVFMNPFRHSFDLPFPIEYTHENRPPNKPWVTQGIKNSSKKTRLSNSLNKQPNLTEHTKLYIARYKTLYKRVIRDAKRRDNDNYILQAQNKSKAIWRVIHKETGKTSPQDQDIIIVKNSEEVSYPGKVAELFNSYFCEISKQLLKEEGKKRPTHGNYQLKIKKNTNSIFPPSNNRK